MAAGHRCISERFFNSIDTIMPVPPPGRYQRNGCVLPLCATMSIFGSLLRVVKCAPGNSSYARVLDGPVERNRDAGFIMSLNVS